MPVWLPMLWLLLLLLLLQLQPGYKWHACLHQTCTLSCPCCVFVHGDSATLLPLLKVCWVCRLASMSEF